MKSVEKTPYYYWEGEFNDHLCDAIIQEGNTFTVEQATVDSNRDIQTNLRNGLVSWVHDNHWINGLVEQYVRRANQLADWNFRIEGKEKIQFGTYPKEAFYTWHRDCDVESDLYRKLSVTVQLTDPSTYEGGDFQLKAFASDEVLIEEKLRKRGTIIVFPSILKHQVTKVTKGTRQSLVQWYNGPDFT